MSRDRVDQLRMSRLRLLADKGNHRAQTRIGVLSQQQKRRRAEKVVVT